MKKTDFIVSKMDCPCEEQIIRMALDGIERIAKLEFDIPNSKLVVYHTAEDSVIEAKLKSLNLGANLVSTVEADAEKVSDDVNQRRILWIVLAINFGFFLLELIYGIIAKSVGLLGDSIDMLADALVYGLSLMAVAGTVALKKRVAGIAGYFQLTLAILGFAEVIRRFLGVEQMPSFTTMIVISSMALVGNALSLFFLQKARSSEVHIKASMIFTSNDIIVNLGVIIAGVLVNWLNTNIPDLVVGTVAFSFVLIGSFRILKLSK